MEINLYQGLSHENQTMKYFNDKRHYYELLKTSVIIGLITIFPEIIYQIYTSHFTSISFDIFLDVQKFVGGISIISFVAVGLELFGKLKDKSLTRV